jgi:hypothetical protein
MLIEFLNEVADNLTILFSISILLISFILTAINWKILKISNEVLEETIKVRKSLEMPSASKEPHKKPTR